MAVTSDTTLSTARHVWKVYDVASHYVEKKYNVSASRFPDPTIGQSPRYILSVGTDYTFDDQTGKFTLDFARAIVNQDWASAKRYLYAAPYSDTNTSDRMFVNSGGTTSFWYVYEQGTSSSPNALIELLTDYDDLNSGISYTEILPESETIQGSTLKKTVSSTSSGAYPSNGVGTASGTTSNWYVYQGSDSIDPTAVSYSNTKPKAGETIAVTVTPRANTYGGTISYRYEYSTDGGGSWAFFSGTDTSYNIQIPQGASQFMVRVRASDGWGFTSSTYVYGANLTVENVRGYIGVDETARKVKAVYIGVDGTARKVKNGYVGVDDIARTWF